MISVFLRINMNLAGATPEHTSMIPVFWASGETVIQSVMLKWTNPFIIWQAGVTEAFGVTQSSC